MDQKKRVSNRIERLLEHPEIRKLMYDGQYYYSAVDLVRRLSGSTNSEQYWRELKRREPILEAICEQLEYPMPDGEAVLLDMLRSERVFRLIQAIPSEDAEPYKLWLAKNAQARLDEAENPELAVLRSRRAYQDKGYTKRWIDKRLHGVTARHELTSEWYRRGATDSEQFRGLTNELMQATFGMDVEKYRQHKHLNRPSQNLRDHMTDLELVLMMLGETTAAALHRNRGSYGMDELQADVRDAGQIAARTLRDIEMHSGRRIMAA